MLGYRYGSGLDCGDLALSRLSGAASFRFRLVHAAGGSRDVTNSTMIASIHCPFNVSARETMRCGGYLVSLDSHSLECRLKEPGKWLSHAQKSLKGDWTS